MKGKIKKLIRDRGFGFIETEDGKEIFFHRSALEGVGFEALEEGGSVEFDTERGPKGMRAANVKAIEG
ncbi:MAG: cold shock domain-containing protein [Candidatus Omnitrophota bacterium]|nr:MAG: cold shock domain-containing protein [Candidatus Omnitrophota bacterium]